MTTESLLQKTMGLIAEASAKAHVSELSRLTKIAERITVIQQKQKTLDADLASLEHELHDHQQSAKHLQDVQPLASPLNGSGQADRSEPFLGGPLAITINWASIGRARPLEVICERKASDTLRRFFEVVLDQFGEATLGKLSAIRASRAQPLSRRPEVDFINRRRGVLYQNQRVGRSDWHVLTNSTTPEKVELIQQASRALGFPPGAIRIQKVDVQKEFMKLMEV